MERCGDWQCGGKDLLIKIERGCCQNLSENWALSGDAIALEG
jgi:hypothetical protein